MTDKNGDSELAKALEKLELAETLEKLEKLGDELRDSEYKPAERASQRRDEVVQAWTLHKKKLADTLDKEFEKFLQLYNMHVNEAEAEEKCHADLLETVDEKRKNIAKNRENPDTLKQLLIEGQSVLKSAEDRPPRYKHLPSFPVKVSAVFSAFTAEVTVEFPKECLRPLQETVKKLSETEMCEGVPVPAYWFDHFRSFVDGSTSVDPGKIPNYPVSNDLIIDDIRVLPKDLYDSVECVLGATGPVYYKVKKQEDTWVLVDSIDIDTPLFLFASIRESTQDHIINVIQREGHSYGCEVFNVFVSVSRTGKDVKKEFFVIRKGSETKWYPNIVRYQPSNDTKMPEIKDDDVLGGRNLARIKSHDNGNKMIVLAFER